MSLFIHYDNIETLKKGEREKEREREKGAVNVTLVNSPKSENASM